MTNATTIQAKNIQSSSVNITWVLSTRQTINAIENDNYEPSLSLAFKIAKLFGKPVEEIFLDE